MIFHTQKHDRIILSSILLVSVFVLPSWVTLIAGALLAIRFTRYFELSVAALLIDALYAPYGHMLFGLFGFAIVYILVIDYLRERIRMRDNHTLY